MPFGLVGGLLSGAGSLIGGLAAGSAASQQSAAANRAIDLQQQEFQQTTQNLAPFLQGGTNSLAELLALFGIGAGGTTNPNAAFLQPISATVGAPPSPNNPGANFQASPGYQYQLGQAQNAIQNSAAGKTGAVSGNMMRALQTNATGLAGQDYWNWYNALVNNYGARYQDASNNRNSITQILAGLASSGQNAAVSQGGFGQNYASNAGALGLYGANARAAGTLGVANSLSNFLQTPGVNNSLNYLFGNGGDSGYGGDYGGVAGGNPYPAGYFGNGSLPASA